MTECPSFEDLDTPALLLDRARARTNAARFEERAAALGVALRVHLKTAKSVEVARWTPSVFSHGGAVSTLREAEVFAEAGVPDLFLALVPDPRKGPRLAALGASGARITVGSDSVAHVRALGEAVGAGRPPLQVAIEIDCGDGRGGLHPEDGEVLPLAREVAAAPGLELAGVFTHGGHSYRARTPADRREIARAERDAVLRAAGRLGAAGFTPSLASVGSTPTLADADDLAGISEIRAGVFVFSDLFQAGLGVTAEEDVALDVLATVVGHHRGSGHLLVDAGALALSKDRSTAALGEERDWGFGRALDLEGRPLAGRARVLKVWQEHGLVGGEVPLDPVAHPVGSRLRILPNHACLTAAAWPDYVLHEAGRVIGRLPRVQGW